MPTKTTQPKKGAKPAPTAVGAGIPRLRFPGFSGAPDSAKASTGNWEGKKLGEGWGERMTF